jgi:spore maturation protein SpmB
MKEPIKKGVRSGFKVAWDLLKIIIPVIFLITFLKGTFLFQYVANIFSPVMRLFGLPGDVALVLVVGIFLSVHAAVGIAVSLNPTPVEITVMGLMIAISHSLLIETAVLKKLQVNYMRMALLRLAVSFVVGICANLVVQWIL